LFGRSKDDQTVPHIGLVYLATFIRTFFTENTKDCAVLEYQGETKRLHVDHRDLMLKELM